MEKGIPAGLCIIFVTGHRSIDGVSDKQLQATSDILQLKSQRLN